MVRCVCVCVCVDVGMRGDMDGIRIDRKDIQMRGDDIYVVGAEHHCLYVAIALNTTGWTWEKEAAEMPPHLTKPPSS